MISGRRRARNPKRRHNLVRQARTLGNQPMMRNAGCRDDGQEVERPEEWRATEYDRGDLDPILGQHTHDRWRRVEPGSQPLGCESAIVIRNSRKKMNGEFLVAADLVAVVNEFLHEEFGGRTKQRRVAHPLCERGEFAEVRVAEVIVHTFAIQLAGKTGSGIFERTC
jgi:hypothetical protein